MPWNQRQKSITVSGIDGIIYEKEMIPENPFDVRLTLLFENGKRVTTTEEELGYLTPIPF